MFLLLDDVNSNTTVTAPEISVTTLIEGQFTFPKKTKLVSAIHEISVSKPLAEPQRLEIQHCVKLETQAQTKRLHFVSAPSSPTILPYQFTLIEGGQFNPGSRHGVIDIACESSCLIAIVVGQKRQPIKINEESYAINHGKMNQITLNELLQCNIFIHHIDPSRGITPFVSFVYTGVINYEKKDDEWMTTLSVMKDLESYSKVTIVH